MRIAFIDGVYLPADNATISIFDRGFLFGDAIYEVLPVYKGKALFTDYHFERLFSSLEKTRIGRPDYNLTEVVQQLIEKNGSGDLQVYLQVTRGNQGLRNHDIPAFLKPTLVGFTIHNPYATYEEKEPGLRAKLIEDIRWSRCDIKATSLLGNILLNDDAVSSGYHTAILQRDGLITEGSAANVFMVDQEGRVKTPPLNHHCLPGITRKVTIELCNNLGWECQEGLFTVDELFAAREVWITSTTKGIYPVTNINGNLIADGKAGSYWRTIDPLYQELINI